VQFWGVGPNSGHFRDFKIPCTTRYQVLCRLKTISETCKRPVRSRKVQEVHARGAGLQAGQIHLNFGLSMSRWPTQQ